MNKTGVNIFIELSKKYNLPTQVIKTICTHPFLFANRKISQRDEKPLMFTYLGKIKIKKNHERQKDNQTDKVTELIEYMVYFKLSYPTGNKDTCEVQLNDVSNEIITPSVTYKMTDNVYLYLYLLSNKAVANIYKAIKDDQKV